MSPYLKAYDDPFPQQFKFESPTFIHSIDVTSLYYICIDMIFIV